MTDKKGSKDVGKGKGKGKAKETAPSKEDEELSALLDSALEDFSKDAGKSKSGSQSSQAAKEEEKRPEPPSSLWNEEFLKQTTARFEENIQALFSPGSDGTLSAEQLGENIQRLAEVATQTAGIDASPDLEFSGIIAQTLKNLSDNTENIQSQISEGDLMSILGSFGSISDPNEDPHSLLPVMKSMMQGLLSKDILAPTLAALAEKYPQWLEENKTKLSPEDFQRFTEQLKLMKEICDELETELPNDSAEVRSTRFDKVMGLMQKIQDCGQPPVELAGEFDPILRVDEQGTPLVPSNFPQNQCNLM